MWEAAILFAAVGLVLAFNLFGSADRLAGNSRLLPRWLRGPGSDDPMTHRIIGAVFMLFAALSGYAAFVGR
jgi:hypothetical protein